MTRKTPYVGKKQDPNNKSKFKGKPINGEGLDAYDDNYDGVPGGSSSGDDGEYYDEEDDSMEDEFSAQL